MKEAVNYDKDSGRFVWNKRPLSHFKSIRAANAWNARFAQKETGFIDSNGHLQIKINGKKYLAHRMAFLFIYNYIPENIDHINGDKKDNSILNLRECTKSQNAANTKSIPVYRTKSGKWRAQICKNYKIKHIGTFDTKTEAEEKYKMNHRELFGEYSPF